MAFVHACRLPDAYQNRGTCSEKSDLCVKLKVGIVNLRSGNLDSYKIMIGLLNLDCVSDKIGFSVHPYDLSKVFCKRT